MQTVASKPSLRAALSARRPAGRVGLVPTMGALHEGHGRLIDQARTECATVVVTIFVNPLQFDRDDDLQKYPRQLERDLAFCADHGADLVFAPPVEEVYPRPPACTVTVGSLAQHLCGRHRPGHFDGVATVVLKLFQMIQPDRAYFGQKDRQQLTIIERMVSDFDMPVEVVGVPTVRAGDGLALSSRNQHLDPEGRAIAPRLYQALREADRLISTGERNPQIVVDTARALLPSDGQVRLEYLEVVSADDLQPVSRIEAPVVIAAALWVGSTRLIDNIVSAPRSAGAAGTS
jgi:pantoate--beta-alanine ligase